MRYIGLDLGSRTLGVSLSDPSGLIASSYTVIRHNEEYDRLVTEVKKIVEEYMIQIKMVSILILKKLIILKKVVYYIIIIMLEKKY